MKAEIGRLRQEPGAYTSFDFQFSPSADGDDFVLLRPVHVSGTLTFGGNTFLLSGRLEGRARVPCGRCLRPVDEDLSADFEEEFDEAEFPGDDAVLDLEDVAGQIWLTAIPMRLLCHEGCKGLCPLCGKDLNTGECDCPKASGDPRFAALKDLLDGRE